MNAVLTLAMSVTALFALALAADVVIARRWPLAMSALWNAVLVAALILVPAVWLLPRWELAVLPAKVAGAEAVGEPTQAIAPGKSLAAEPVQAAEQLAQVGGGRASAAAGRPLAKTVKLKSPAKTARSLAWRPRIAELLAAIYVFGLVVSLIHVALSIRAVRRLRRGARPMRAVAWLTSFQAWQPRIAPRWNEVLLQSDKINVPIVLGWWRPAIVIPDSLADETGTKTINAILIHELAHVERADCGWQLFERLVRAAYWFHPLFWLASRQIAAVRERACDDFSIHTLADREAYAATLLAVAKDVARRQRLGLAMAVVRTSKLEQRLAAIDASAGRSQARANTAVRFGTTIALLALVVAVISVRLVRAEPKPTLRSSSVDAADKKQPVAPQPTPSQAAPGDSVKKSNFLSANTNESEATDYQFYDNVADRFPQTQREAAKRFFVHLWKQEYDHAEEPFAPQLREALPANRLQGIFESLSMQYGKLQPRASLHYGRIGNRDLPELMLNWGRQNVISTRLLFDEHDKISGLWLGENPLVADENQPQIAFGTGASGGKVAFDSIAFGEPMQELAKANLSLTINLLDEQGQPVEIKDPWDVSISFYRQLTEDEPSTAKDHWNDTTTGERWRFVENESHAQNRAERLSPGVYRAFVIRRPGGWYELSDPIVLDSTQRDTVIDLPKQPAASVIVNLVDELTGKPVTGADVRIRSDDPRIPSYQHGGSEFPEARVEFKDLLPGRHKIIAHRRAPGVGQLEYDPAEAHVQLERGKTAELTLKMRGKLLAPEEMARRWPFTLKGQVTDGDGHPVAGATIKAYSGAQSLSEMGQTTSDREGRYVLQFGPGYWPLDGASFGSAVVSVRKEGLFDPDVGARKPFLLAGAAEPPLEGRDGRTVLKINSTHDLNFVMQPAVGVSVELIDDVFKPLPNTKFSLETIDSRSDRPILTETTNAKGQAAISGISPREAMRWSLQGTPFPERSNPVLFTGPGKYKTRLQAYVDRTTQSRFLRIEQVLDSTGKDVTAEVVQDDPLMREPLSEELQTACRAIAEKLLAANRLWIEPAPRDAWPYQFELHFDAVPNGQKSRVTYENNGPDSINPHATHGMTYASQLAGLADAENVVFRAMEVTPQRVTLAYTFRKPIRVQAGNGVDNFWRGSISAVSREGIVVLDPSRDVPLEVQGDVLHERFEDFRLFEPGQYAPLRIQIALVRHSDLAFDWVFHTYEPDLWMLDESRNPTLPEAPPIMTLDKLRTDGQPARRLDNLNDRRIIEPPRR